MKNDMTGTSKAEFWLTEDSGTRRFALAFAVGLVVEVTALALLLPVMTHQQPPPAETPAIVKLSVVSPAPPAPKPPPPKPVPPPPKPVVPPPPLPPPPPVPSAHHVLRRTPPPRHITPPQPPPQQVQAPPPPPGPLPPTGGQVDAFSAAIKRALQARADEVYPQAAQMAHETGSPQLTFTYLNGAVTGIDLTRSSGFPLLDEAALDDARTAAYPPPPAGFAGRTYHITVSVDFILNTEDNDGD